MREEGGKEGEGSALEGGEEEKEEEEERVLENSWRRRRGRGGRLTFC